MLDRDENIYTFSDINDWISYTANIECELVSPGGAAQLFGVQRQAVNNWIYRDRAVRYFRYGQKRKGEYGVIPVKDIQKMIARREERKSQRERKKTGAL
jgi:hypothetical protein